MKTYIIALLALLTLAAAPPKNIMAPTPKQGLVVYWITEIGTVYSINPYGPRFPIVVIYHGKPFTSIDCYSSNSLRFKPGDHVSCEGAYIVTPDREYFIDGWLQALK